MLIEQSSIIHYYEKIQNRAISGCVTVFIFVAFDADSLCALKILTQTRNINLFINIKSLLKADNIAYKVFPVTGYSQLQEKIDESKESENVNLKQILIQSLIFINCGGVIDLTQKWFVTEKTKVRAYLFDNHRPIHHHNMDDKNNVSAIKNIIQEKYHQMTYKQKLQYLMMEHKINKIVLKEKMSYK